MLKYMYAVIAGLLLLAPVTAQPSKTAADHYNEGIKLIDNKEYSAALEAFKTAVGKDPNYTEALYQAGWCNNELEKYDAAIRYLQKARLKWPDKSKVYRELGYAQWKLKSYDEAIATFEKAIQLDPKSPLPYKYLGNIYFDEREAYEKARENYKKYIALDGEGDANSWYDLGWCENHLENYTEAITALKKCIEKKPESGDAYNELGYAYSKLEKAEEGIDAYNEAKRLLPSGSTAYLGLGDIYKDLKKDHAEAIKNYQKAIELNPKSQKANYATGWCYNERGDYEAAIPYLTKTLEINNKYSAAITELGYAYYMLTRYDDALVVLNKGIATNPTNLSLYYAGLCYLAKGDKTSAKQLYGKMKANNFESAEKLLEKINKP